MSRINPQRLLDDLRTLRTFGAQENGVVRPTLSAIDMQSRAWLMERMRDAGLSAHMDGVSNVIGQSPNAGPALLLGSHSDTQPRGGWLDGALGVIYALEVARALLENPDTADLSVDAVSLADEEGTFLGCLGSRSLCGVLDESAVAQAQNAQGLSLTQALADAGLADTPRTSLDTKRYIGYLEAHIEQGPYLEEQGDQIGVVTSIVGIRGCTVHFAGEQNHAGTTPMDRRKDAGVALFEFATRVREKFQHLAGERTVWTIGQATLSPGAPSIIPGAAQMLLQFRDPDEARLQAMHDAALSLTAQMQREGPVSVSLESMRQAIPPTIMDANLQMHLAEAASSNAPEKWVKMPSAAGHDPMVLSHHLPCAMLFIPSIRGISHDFAEDSHDADIVAGCAVMADAAVSILRAAR